MSEVKKKYRITLTEEQLRVVQKCTEQYFRLLLGQPMDFADEIAFGGEKANDGNPEWEKDFDRRIQRRDAVYEIMNAVFKIVYGNGWGAPNEKTDDCMIAECIWDAIRTARGLNHWGHPLQIGGEPIPEIEEVFE